MKKLITILIIVLISLNLEAQDGRVLTLLHEESWKVNFNQEDKQAHFAFWYFEGVVVTSAAYTLLKDTKLSPFWAKFWSTTIGVVGGIILGDFVENYQKNHGGIYNPKDLSADIYGSIAGSFTVRFALWGSIPRSKVPKGTIIYENRYDAPDIYMKRQLRKHKRYIKKRKLNK